MLDDGVKVISARTLDNKTITLTDDKKAIEVQVSADADNAVRVQDDGIFVPAGILLTDLAGNPIGRLLQNI